MAQRLWRHTVAPLCAVACFLRTAGTGLSLILRLTVWWRSLWRSCQGNWKCAFVCRPLLFHVHSPDGGAVSLIPMGRYCVSLALPSLLLLLFLFKCCPIRRLSVSLLAVNRQRLLMLSCCRSEKMLRNLCLHWMNLTHGQVIACIAPSVLNCKQMDMAHQTVVDGFAADWCTSASKAFMLLWQRHG